MVDSYSKWLDFEIVSSCDTKNTTLCLSKWFSQYGIPVQLISDKTYGSLIQTRTRVMT